MRSRPLTTRGLWQAGAGHDVVSTSGLKAITLSGDQRTVLGFRIPYKRQCHNNNRGRGMVAPESPRLISLVSYFCTMSLLSTGNMRACIIEGPRGIVQKTQCAIMLTLASSQHC